MKRLIGMSIFCMILVAGFLPSEARAAAGASKPVIIPSVQPPNVPADKPAVRMIDPSIINNPPLLPTSPSDGSKWFRKKYLRNYLEQE